MATITNIEDLKKIYKRRVPKMFYDYAESGSWTEQTFRDNVNDFEKLRFRQRVAVDMTGSCLLYTSPSPRDATLSRMPSSA